MISRASASRYARALLDAVKDRNPEQVEHDLDAFLALLKQHPDLHHVLTNPAVPASGKRGLVQELVSRLNLSTPAVRLLVLLAEHDRLTVLPKMLAAYRDRLLEYRKIVRAEVTTALPLAPDRMTQIQQRLAEVTGRHVMLTTKVDPALIGGVIARVGSTVYDGSVATQLVKIRERLVEA